MRDHVLEQLDVTRGCRHTVGARHWRPADAIGPRSRSRGAAQAHDGEVLSAGVETDLKLQVSARLALHEDLRSSARRTARPARAGLEARLAVGGIATEVDLVWRARAKGGVWPVLVVPGKDILDLPTDGIVAHRHQGQEAKQPLGQRRSHGRPPQAALRS